MKFIISGKNIDATPGLRTGVEDKLGKLEKYFTADTEVHVTLGVEKDRQKTFLNEFEHLLHVPFEFEDLGTSVLYYRPEEYIKL